MIRRTLAVLRDLTRGHDDLMALAHATAEPRPSPADLFAECCDGMDADWGRESTPLFDAAVAYVRESLAELAALETYEDFLYVTGGDA